MLSQFFSISPSIAAYLTNCDPVSHRLSTYPGLFINICTTQLS